MIVAEFELKVNQNNDAFFLFHSKHFDKGVLLDFGLNDYFWFKRRVFIVDSFKNSLFSFFLFNKSKLVRFYRA